MLLPAVQNKFRSSSSTDYFSQWAWQKKGIDASFTNGATSGVFPFPSGCYNDTALTMRTQWTWDKGSPCVDLTFSGTTSSANYAYFGINELNPCPATLNTTIKTTLTMSLLRGTSTINAFQFWWDEQDASGSVVYSGNTTPITLNLGTFTNPKNTTDMIVMTNASAAFIEYGYIFGFTNSVASNFTLRIWPYQIEHFK